MRPTAITSNSRGGISRRAVVAEYLRTKGTRKSVEELADELYEKYYAGKVEREEFDKRMNLPEWRESYPGAVKNVGRGRRVQRRADRCRRARGGRGVPGRLRLRPARRSPPNC